MAWGLVLLYIVTFTWLAILRHASFNSTSFDLGIYDQVVWNTLHGRRVKNPAAAEIIILVKGGSELGHYLLVFPAFVIHVYSTHINMEKTLKVFV